MLAGTLRMHARLPFLGDGVRPLHFGRDHPTADLLPASLATVDGVLQALSL